MPMRTMLLCRTPNVVGCFFATQDVFEPVPTAYEKFVRSREGMKRYQEEAEQHVSELCWRARPCSGMA